MSPILRTRNTITKLLWATTKIILYNEAKPWGNFKDHNCELRWGVLMRWSAFDSTRSRKYIGKSSTHTGTVRKTKLYKPFIYSKQLLARREGTTFEKNLQLGTNIFYICYMCCFQDNFEDIVSPKRSNVLICLRVVF